MRKPKLLLVDDESRFIDSLQNILTHYEYDCAAALDGEEAFALLQQEHFDVALLDVGLPNISGCTIAKHINTQCLNTTVIMLTGLNTVETAVKAMKHGAYDFLSKPIDHTLLLKTIEKALEHNALKKELSISEKRFRLLAEVAWEGIAIQQNGLLMEANRQFYNLFGYLEGELDKENFLEKILVPEDREVVTSYFRESHAMSFEMTGIRKDGSTFAMESKSCIIEYQGSPSQVLIIRDISERKRHEQEKLMLQEKLAKSNKLKALGMMAGSVAHDLNNILTAIVSYPDLLLMQMDESDSYYHEIKKIQDAGRQAAAVVSDLVSIARGGIRDTSVANLNEIILQYLRSIEHSERLLNFPKVTIQTSLDQELKHIECSPLHIRKLLLNMVGNAMESMENDGTVHVETRNFQLSSDTASDMLIVKPNKYVKLVVSDNGPGIDPDIIEHIFNPFFSTKKDGKSGTGLGLTIVWNIVQEHGGWIEAKNLHPGAAFEVYLPVTEKPITKQRKSVISEAIMGNQETILLVDDEEDQNVIMGRMIDILGYTSVSVTSGELAIEYLEEHSVDLVILDMTMGEGMNGRQTYEEILKVNPQQKAIILSGYLDKYDVEKAQELGILTVLEKPVTFSILGKLLKEVFASRPYEAGTTVQN